MIHIDFSRLTFDWVDLDSVLQKWQITRDQFVDACMLAGTEYCLTYPYLNLGHFHPAASGRFNFDAAVYIIKQAPLINWMQTFPTDDMKNDHIAGYCICKVLVQNSPVLHLSDHSIRPLGAGSSGSPPQVPYDFHVIMGEKLPKSLYFLMLNGTISHKLPQALAKGEWTDKSQPLVDTSEFRSLLEELKDYREAALGLIARHLHVGFQNKQILCKAFWDPHPIRTGMMGPDMPPNARVIAPAIQRGLRWQIHKEAVDSEMQRQGTDRVDFKFCLAWHANEWNIEGKLVKGLQGDGGPWASNDTNSLSALVHFMVLENLGLIESDDGAMTVLGSVLKDTPRNLQECQLVALEMMKFGVLSGEPFDAAQPDRPFPEQVNYPKSPVEPRTKAILILSRVMSLVPMKLRNDMWNADVEFDLAAFHSLVRILKRALRQLVQASLASLLLKDLQRVKMLPPGFMCATPKREDHLQTPAMLPTFMLPRACMGIVALFFLKYTGDPSQFQREVQAKFPCCVQPLEDLRTAFLFWEDLKRCTETIAEQLDMTDLANDVQSASTFLYAQQQRLNVYPHQQPRS